MTSKTMKGSGDPANRAQIDRRFSANEGRSRGRLRILHTLRSFVNGFP